MNHLCEEHFEADRRSQPVGWWAPDIITWEEYSSCVEAAVQAAAREWGMVPSLPGIAYENARAFSACMEALRPNEVARLARHLACLYGDTESEAPKREVIVISHIEAVFRHLAG